MLCESLDLPLPRLDLCLIPERFPALLCRLELRFHRLHLPVQVLKTHTVDVVHRDAPFRVLVTPILTRWGTRRHPLVACLTYLYSPCCSILSSQAPGDR